MTGLNRYPDKERRKARRFNHIAKDLGTPKYRQRIIKNKNRHDSVADKDSYGEDEEG